jgi:hypothetical protein
MSTQRIKRGTFLDLLGIDASQELLPFHREQIFLSAVAALAGRHYIVPIGTSAADEGHNVIKRQLIARDQVPAIVANPSIHMTLPPAGLPQGTGLFFLALNSFRADLHEEKQLLVRGLVYLVGLVEVVRPPTSRS